MRSTLFDGVFPLSQVSAAYAPTPDAVRHARALAVDTGRAWNLPGPLTGVVELVVSELVGNAVRHAWTRIDVTLVRSPGRVNVAVRDYVSAPAHIGGPAGDGRGLLIVDAVATHWGCTPIETPTGRGVGKVTWATLAA
jgi:anti-sigma regulatory factor (Ser/Thr protein kinase)